MLLRVLKKPMRLFRMWTVAERGTAQGLRLLAGGVSFHGALLLDATGRYGLVAPSGSNCLPRAQRVLFVCPKKPMRPVQRWTVAACWHPHEGALEVVGTFCVGHLRLDKHFPRHKYGDS
uniref:Uncharacterized protein n=1 Tax=Noctiluca scintillans TaxID=2966 RepID=A0A7S1FC85_NOCSC